MTDFYIYDGLNPVPDGVINVRVSESVTRINDAFKYHRSLQNIEII